MRYFVAIKLPRQIKEEVVRIQKEFQSIDLEAKWVEFKNLHLTLKFLGEIKEEELPRVKEIISGVSNLSKSFKLNLFNLGFFPDIRRPRVLWVDVEPQDKPIKIIEYLEEQFLGIGIPKEKRKPHPHITLARIKTFKNIQKIKEKILSLKVEKIEWQVLEVSLFKSILKPQGPIYEEIFSISITK